MSGTETPELPESSETSEPREIHQPQPAVPRESQPEDDDAAAPRSPWLQWTGVVPIVALVALAATFGREIGFVLVVVVALLLGGSVLAAVHHAEVIAAKVGEPYGSLVLAVAVTVIEVGLIVTLMVSGGSGVQTLARDTVFAAAMITANGILGLSIVVGARRHGLAVFNKEGTGSALATLTAVAALCLVLPTFTTSRPGREYSGSQLAFAAVASLVLYVLFVLTQTGRHRDFFLPVDREGRPLEGDDHHEPPPGSSPSSSVALLLVALVAVVGLAKVESPAIESGVVGAGLPPSFVGVVIALLVLAPESLAAYNSARRERVQTSLNLALGSGMASIGLTIPVIAVLSPLFDTPLELGLGSTQMVLLGLTVVIGILTVVPGRASRIQGAIHLVLLLAFVFLAANP